MQVTQDLVASFCLRIIGRCDVTEGPLVPGQTFREEVDPLIGGVVGGPRHSFFVDPSLNRPLARGALGSKDSYGLPDLTKPQGGFLDLILAKPKRQENAGVLNSSRQPGNQGIQAEGVDGVEGVGLIHGCSLGWFDDPIGCRFPMITHTDAGIFLHALSEQKL